MKDKIYMRCVYDRSQLTTARKRRSVDCTASATEVVEKKQVSWM